MIRPRVTAGLRPRFGLQDNAAELSHLRVLVVDDEEDARLTQRALAEIPWFTCTVDCVHNYADALAAIRRDLYDVILLDHALAVRSGVDLLAEAFGDTLPEAVVLLTGMGSHQMDAAASPAGIAHLLEKSEMRAGPLERSVRYALERARIERDLRNARAFFHAAFDAMPDHVAILDEAGHIVEVNRAWKEFAARNGHDDSRAQRQENYLTVCDVAERAGDAVAAVVGRGIREMLAGVRDTFTAQYPCHSPSEERWFLLTASRIRIDGAPRIMLGHKDVTPQLRTERELRDSAERYRGLFNANPTPLFVIDDATAALLSANDAAVARYGYSIDELRALTAYDLRVPEERDGVDRFLSAPGIGLTSNGTGRHRTKTGEIIDVEVMLHSVEYGDKPCHIALVTDVTERRRAEHAQSAALATADMERRRLAATVEIMPVGVFIMDVNGGAMHVNEAAQKIWSGPGQSIQSGEDYGRLRAWFEESGNELALDDWAAVVAQRTGQPVESQLLQIERLDGSRGHILSSAAPIVDATGQVTGSVAVSVDMTERHERDRERAVLASTLEFERNQLSRIFAKAPAVMAVMRGADLVFELVNEEGVRLLGRNPIGKRGAEAIPELVEQGYFVVAERVRLTGEPHFASHVPTTLRRENAADEHFIFDVTFQPLREADGSITGVVMHGLDVTKQVASANALSHSEAQHRSLVELSPDGIIIHVGGLIVFANTAAAHILHASSATELLGYPVSRLPHPEVVALARERVKSVGAGEIVPLISTRWVTMDGAVRHIDVTSVALDFDGAPAIHTVFRDTTELNMLAEQLRQAQKMEAVGQLAGGVAHDFNNLLTVIKANVEFLLEDLDAGDPRRAEVTDVRDAADRAAGLTRQLLAFSRKQILQMRIIDSSTVVARVKPMLSRLIREDISLDTQLVGPVGSIRADPGQLEQVLLNLAVNARDAMRGGGRLLIVTSERLVSAHDKVESGSVVIPGRYAAIAVTDTGTGMTDEVRARIFEPFFTTKPVGEGTGLGLATAYGIVRQSAGYLQVESVLGRGTTVTVLLPIVEGKQHVTAETAAVAWSGSETILVVEDMDSLREIAKRVLQRRGYTVLEARNGAAALEVAAAHAGPIHAVLTDVVMPEMNGVELVRLLQVERPEVCVLYMSGYSDDEGVRRGIEKGSAMFLPKPFSPAQLLLQVHQALAH